MARKQYEYRLRRVARNERGLFVDEKESRVLSVSGRREAEFATRRSSRAHARHLVTLSRNGVILVHMINARIVDAHAVVADASSRRASATETR